MAKRFRIMVLAVALLAPAFGVRAQVQQIALVTDVAGSVHATRPVGATRMAAVSDLTLHRAGEGGISALGGLRAGESRRSITTLTPRRTRIMQGTPTFAWMSEGGFDAFTVRVDDEDQRAAVDGLASIEASFDGDADTASRDYVVGAFYADLGLLFDAVAAFTRIAQRHLDSALVHEILGKLYSRTQGRGDPGPEAGPGGEELKCFG